MISRTKIYNNFGVFLLRNKIINSHAIAKLLLEKFAYSSKTSAYKTITSRELKEIGVLKKRRSVF